MCPSLYLEDAKHTTCSALHHQLCGGTFVGRPPQSLASPAQSSVFFGKISPNFDLKNMILTYTKDFS
jgi:hypothetical protein